MVEHNTYLFCNVVCCFWNCSSVLAKFVFTKGYERLPRLSKSAVYRFLKQSESHSIFLPAGVYHDTIPNFRGCVLLTSAGFACGTVGLLFLL